MRYIQLTFDPAEETDAEFEIRCDEAIVATGLPAEEVTLVIREIVHCAPPNVDYVGNA
jgi:hypothetical protein